MNFSTIHNHVPDDDTIWQWNDTNSIGVGLSPSGELSSLEIRPDWKSSIPSKNLAQEILATYSGALSLQLQQSRPLRADGPTETYGQEVDDDVDFDLFLRVMEEQRHYLAAYSEKISLERSFQSEDGNITVTALGGSPTAISFDDFWLSISSGPAISRQLKPLLIRAIESENDIDHEMREDFPAIAEFRLRMKNE